MTKIEIDMPENIDNLMEIYENYENENKDDKFFYTPDILQDMAYSSNPITPSHEKYYNSRYKSVYHPLMQLFLYLSIVFFLIYFIGYYVILNLSEFDVWANFISRTGIFVFFLLYSIIVPIYLARSILNKWNWKYPSIMFPLSIGFILAIIYFFKVEPGSTESFYAAVFSSFGMSLGPALLMLSLFYKNYKYITDYGGIHLHLGWIYRICQTNGDLKTLNISFKRLLYDLDNWLNLTSKVLIKNKFEILEGFYFNILSVKNFLGDITQNFKPNFQTIFSGLLIDEILKSKVFSYIKPENKKISCLKRYDLKYINHRLALTQIPEIINLIELLTSKKIEIRYYSLMEKFKKFSYKILGLVVFILSSLIPLITPIIQ